MFRYLLFIALFSTSAYAQFFGLATPADGSRVYFATPLRQKDTTQPTYGKLFQIDDSGLKLLLARDIVTLPPDPFGAGYLTNDYDLVSADVSSDGQVFAAAGAHDCYRGSTITCEHIASIGTTITSGGQSHGYAGMLKLSPNGKWAFGITDSSVNFGILVNVATGEQTNICSRGCLSAINRRSVSNDGTVVFSDNAQIFIQRGTDVQGVLTPGVYASDAVIDAAGRTIVFVAGPCQFTIPSSCELRITSPGAASTDLLVAAGYSPSMSDDGRQVLYLSNKTGTPQAYLINTDGSGDQSLTNEMDGLYQAVLSGDGTIAYAVTLGGRLLRISVASAAVQELIPGTPFFTSPGSRAIAAVQKPLPGTPYSSGPSLAPGKLVSLPGVGFSTSTYTATPPLPESLGGVQVSIQGRQARIQSVKPTAIALLVPSDVVVGSSPIHIETSSSSPFEILDTSVVINQFSPEFLYRAEVYGMLTAAHEDWSGLVSDQNPAHPGEILHTYGVGMGPTIPSVPYGESAPSQEPFARLATQPICTAEVLFAGLAPAMAAIYQIDWRVPAGPVGSSFNMTCQFSGSSAQFYGTVPIGTTDGH